MLPRRVRNIRARTRFLVALGVGLMTGLALVLAPLGGGVEAASAPRPLGPSPSGAGPSGPNASGTATGGTTGYDALSEADRRAIQDALIWTGDYVGVASGLFGPKSHEAIAAYAKRVGLPPNVVLDPAQRARLFAAADAVRNAVGFAPVSDGRTGVRLSLPLKLLPKQAGVGSGTRYSSADGSIVVDTLAKPAGEGGLPEMFARLSAAAEGRTVAYKVLRPEFLVVSGEAGDKKFYSRFDAGTVADREQQLRGFTFVYPRTAARTLDPVAIAIADSFVPFPSPEATAQSATSPNAPKPPVAASGPASTRSFVGDAVLVAPGVALARLARNECPSVFVDGIAASWRTGLSDADFALINVPGRSGPAVAPAGAPLAEGATLFALFHADPGSGKPASGEVLAAAALAEQERSDPGAPPATLFSAPLQDNAVILDDQGTLLGFAVPFGKRPATVAGVVPRARYRVVSAERIRSLGPAAADVETLSPRGQALTLGEVATRVAPSILAVTCGPAGGARP